MSSLSRCLSLALPTLLALAGCTVAPADDGDVASSGSAITYRPRPDPMTRDRGVTVTYANSQTGAATSTVALRYDGVNTVYCPEGCLTANYTIWDDLDQVATSSDCDYSLFVASGPYAHGYALMEGNGPILCTGSSFSGSAQIPADLLVDAFDLAIGESSLPAFCEATNHQTASVTFTTYLFAGVSGVESGSSGRTMDVISGSLGGTAPFHPDMPAASSLALTVSLTCD